MVTEVYRQFSLSSKDLRKLRKLTNEGVIEVDVESQVITIDGETISIDTDHAEDLQAAIEKVIGEKNRDIQDAFKTIRDKDRLLESKEELINKLDAEISQLEVKAKNRAITPGEEQFMKKKRMDCSYIDETLRSFEYDHEENYRSDMTPRMKACVLETLAYLRKTIIAIHEGAKLVFEEPDEQDEEPWDPDALIADCEAEQSKSGKSS